MLELLKNAAKKHNLKGFEMIRAVHLDKEPWTCVSCCGVGGGSYMD